MPHPTEQWLYAALGTFTPDQLDTLDALARTAPVSALPRAVWFLIGLAVLVLFAVVWLNLHDRRVRETAALSTVITAKDDTIAQLNADIRELGIAIRKADDAYAAAKGTVVRVAVVPQSLRDSLTVLNTALALAVQRGDSTVPITTAVQLNGQLLACRRQVDTIASAVNGMASDCERRVSTRDSVIQAQRQLVRTMQDKLNATVKLAGLSTPRLMPYVQANYSPFRKAFDTEGGATLRLFGQLRLAGALRIGELSTDTLFRVDSLPRVLHHRADGTVSLRYDFR